MIQKNYKTPNLKNLCAKVQEFNAVKFTSVLLLALILLLPPFSSLAQPTSPFLTLNTEMHTARIGRIDSDKAGKTLLTVSHDKTAKLWNAQTGVLIRTLRVPIGENQEGRLDAGAISPDGKIVAVGGWTKGEWTGSGNYKIYLFDAHTGSMLHRISGLPNVIFDIEFSPNGKYMVATLGGSNGIRIYEIPTNFNQLPESLKLSGSFTDYGGNSYKAAFDHAGRLATVCYDGKIRLYSPLSRGEGGFKLETPIETTAGKQPFSLAFSPDGALLAVGYNDSPTLEVRDGKTLKVLYEPNITDVKNANKTVNKVSFSACGNYLIAGGSYSKYVNNGWWRQIRVYTNKGRGSYTDYPAAGNLIMDIKPIQGGNFIFAGSQPDFGRFTINGSKVFYKNAEINSYRANDRSHFKINNAGTAIGVTPFGKEPLVFDVANRLLTNPAGFQNPQGLEQYTDMHAGIRITDWQNTHNPKINAKATDFLQTHEINRSVDISKDGKKIVFGANWRIYCTDESGKKLWEAPVQGTAWAVNISANNKTVATALDNGTIQWYNMTDGKLLLTLFLHPDNKRWVLWSPQGYFDCSAGAEQLIGWHLNQGADKEALYYPVSRFRSTYHRPDIIDKVLETLNEDEAIRLANIESNRRESQTRLENALPPQVRIFSPANFQEVSSTNVSIEYSATSPGGEEILNVRFLVDGRPVETKRGFIPVGQRRTETQTIAIPQKDVVVQVLAENKFGWSVASEVNIKWKGVAPQQQDLLKPTLYILSIGVSDYKKPEYKLNFAAKDANDFTAAMVAQKGGLYKDVVVRTLTDVKATKDNILDALEWIQRETTSRDMAMIFLAGHGINDNSGVFYFMPHEADLESMRRTCLMFNELKHTASTIAGKVVMFVDACHSGNVWGGRRSAPDINALVNELSDVESGAVVFTSSTGRQFSLEDARWGNGAFTKALIEGLQGKADLFGRGTITVKTLDAYVANRVKELTNGQQAPTAIIPQSMPDFSIGIKK